MLSVAWPGAFLRLLVILFMLLIEIMEKVEN